ncbi:MAG: DUF4440 domain-containing protein [Hahellaceae bacterium]|nr:DUF4440 domain-containing protein [Hahellaceae bacterium]MCP5169338.1 DUF4440 domain-containing protein [Hahellaceae bacterium]
MDELLQETRHFFDAFVSAFSRFDGAEIARRYRAPYLAMNAEGSLTCFTEPADIAGYFQQVVDDYYAQGVRACRYDDLNVVPLGQSGALGTVTWTLLRPDGETVSCWRESYQLHRSGGEMRIFASVDHA